MILVAGILLMALSSDKAVEHSVILASALGISPLIVNSIILCALGRGNINAGGSIGSVLMQLIMIFGILPFFGASFKVKRKRLCNRGHA